MADLIHKQNQEVPILFALTKYCSIITGKPHQPTHSNSEQKGFKVRKHFFFIADVSKLNLKDI